MVRDVDTRRLVPRTDQVLADPRLARRRRPGGAAPREARPAVHRRRSPAGPRRDPAELGQAGHHLLPDELL